MTDPPPDGCEVWSIFCSIQTVIHFCLGLLSAFGNTLCADSLRAFLASILRIINIFWFQRQQHTSGGAVRSFISANCCQLIPPNRFFDGFPDPSQFAAAKLTQYSSKYRNDHGYASCSQEMYTRTLALLQSIHVRCVLEMS